MLRLLRVFVLSTVLAQSQPPPPTPPKTRQEKQQQKTIEQAKAEADQKAASDFSSLVDKVSAELARRNQQQTANEAKYKPSPDGWVAIFTGILVIIGAVQVYVYCRQAAYMRKGLGISLKQAGIASKNSIAAKRTADVLISSERAWLVLEVTRLKSPRVTRNNVLPFNVMDLSFQNHGRTPAFITDICFRYMQTPTPQLETMNYTHEMSGPGKFARGLVVGPGERTPVYPAALEKFGLMNQETFDKIMSGELFVHFYGIVRYSDISGVDRETAFCFTYQRGEVMGLPPWLRSGPRDANRNT